MDTIPRTSNGWVDGENGTGDSCGLPGGVSTALGWFLGAYHRDFRIHLSFSALFSRTMKLHYDTAVTIKVDQRHRLCVFHCRLKPASRLAQFCGSRCIVKLWTCGHELTPGATIILYLRPSPVPIVLDILLNPPPLQCQCQFTIPSRLLPFSTGLPFPLPKFIIHSCPAMNHRERRAYDLYEE